MTGLLIGSLFGGAVSDRLVLAPFCQTLLRLKAYELITESVFSPSNQIWKEITTHLLLSGPCSRYSDSGISAVCARVPDSPRHQWCSLLCHSHLHLQFRYSNAYVSSYSLLTLEDNK